MPEDMKVYAPGDGQHVGWFRGFQDQVGYITYRYQPIDGGGPLPSDVEEAYDYHAFLAAGGSPNHRKIVVDGDWRKRQHDERRSGDSPQRS